MATEKKIDFEASMEKLEAIVRRLESGAESLDSALKLYEEGIGLVRACSDTLDQAELRIKKLQMNRDGTATLVDFATEEGEA